MDGSQFENYCNNYEFNRDEFKNYLDLQVKLMKIHLSHVRAEGDERDKNIIFSEWIATYSRWFRYIWVSLNGRAQ